MKSLFPLSLTVMLVELWDRRWCLSDGWRWSRAWSSSNEAMDDKTNFRRLTYGEPLKGKETKLCSS